MRAKKLLFLATAVAASFSSCTNEDFGIPASEEYTRNFIKEFGLIDPSQDWNLAEGTNVTVKVGDTPAHVKAYMKVDSKYYLVADLENVSGTVKIPFDMPEGTTDIMVKINGTRYFTSPGGTVDPSGVGSRALGGIQGNGLGESGTFGGVEITIEKNTHRPLTLLPDVATEVLSVLPENNISFWNDRNWDDTPVGKKRVTDNFVTYAKEFYLFPEYWDTGSAYNNIIGIYWIEDKAIEGVTEEVVVTNKADQKGSNKEEVIATYNVVRIPFFKYPMNFYTPYQAVLSETYSVFTDIPNWNEADGMWAQLTKNFPDKYSYSNGKYYRIYSDGVSREINSTAIESDINHECAKDIFALNNLYIYTHDGSFGIMDPSQKKVCDFLPGETGGSSSKGKDADFYESWGIHVKLSDYKKFGFYLENKEKVMYSQTILNSLTSDGNEYRQPSYVATFLQGNDTEGNPKRHLCFEDWYADNFDMNDMVFRIYGLDALANQDPDKPIETGTLLDEDIDPTPPGDDDWDEVEFDDEPYNWLLAVEDLGATDDFDFNDIVMGITSVTVGVKGDLPEGTRKVGEPMPYTTYGSDDPAVLYQKVTFKALAAGGTRKAYVFYGDELLYPDGAEGRAEWHAWFGTGGISSTTMINTGYGTDNQAGATCTIYFGAENGDYAFTLGAVEGSVDAKYDKRNDFTSKFKIGIDAVDRISADNISIDYFEQKTNDEGEAYFVKPADAGAAPQMFLIPDGTQWAWPKERSHISSCYSGFADWVKDGNGASDWYKNPSGDVIRY